MLPSSKKSPKAKNVSWRPVVDSLEYQVNVQRAVEKQKTRKPSRRSHGIDPPSQSQSQSPEWQSGIFFSSMPPPPTAFSPFPPMDPPDSSAFEMSTESKFPTMPQHMSFSFRAPIAPGSVPVQWPIPGPMDDTSFVENCDQYRHIPGFENQLSGMQTGYPTIPFAPMPLASDTSSQYLSVAEETGFIGWDATLAQLDALESPVDGQRGAPEEESLLSLLNSGIPGFDDRSATFPDISIHANPFLAVWTGESFGASDMNIPYYFPFNASHSSSSLSLSSQESFQSLPYNYWPSDTSASDSGSMRAQSPSLTEGSSASSVFSPSPVIPAAAYPSLPVRRSGHNLHNQSGPYSVAPTRKAPKADETITNLAPAQATGVCLWNDCGDEINGALADVKAHMQSKHGVDFKGNTRIECCWRDCAKDMERGSLVRHLRSKQHLMTGMVPCPHCDSKQRMDALRKHIETKHQ
ncbi:hypothetical protein C8R43DRAFT_964727 [Mycena crocata]|nr:hypothetical protein C8R43DRAFT_964727 [Mycena crocata]